MKLIAVKSKTITPAVCPECRQSIIRAEREDGSGAVFSGDPSGFHVTKNADGDLVDHFDAAELHGCLV